MFTVYKHIAPNGKVYIGTTKQNVKKRWKSGRGYENNKLFFADITKYGWDNIKHEILCYCRTKQEAEATEKKLIKQHNSNDAKYGYNISLGAGRTKNGKPVVCVETGAIYDTACEAEKATGANKTHIGGCCRKERITAGGFHWLFFDDYKNGIGARKQKNKRAIFCEELNKTFCGVSEAAQCLSMQTSTVSRICNGKIKNTKKYQLSYVEEE